MSQGETELPDETTLPIEEAEGGVSVQPLNSFTLWDFLRMILILGFVIAAIYGIFWLIKKGGRSRVQETPVIRIIGSQLLSSNRGIHLVEVGKQVFLVGTAESSVNLISEITDKESLDEIQVRSTEAQVDARTNFGKILAQLFKPVQTAGNGVPISFNDSVNFMQKQRERIKRMQ